jgi:hypothetical protein
VRRRLPILPALTAIVLALAVAAAAFAAWRPEAHEQGPELTLAPQRLQFVQTKANEALIKLPNAKPGQVATGSTRMTVTGARAMVTAAVTNLRDIAGPNGGKLITSGKLRIVVRCIGQTCGGSGAAYKGPLSQMHTRSLGIWAPGTSRTYTVRVWMQRGSRPPSNTTGDNRFQGSRARFGLVWTATQT